MMSTKKGKLSDRIRGLLVFSEDAAMVQNPVIDNENLSVKMSRETKVMVHHLTVIDEKNIDKAWKNGLDYIWNNMQCSAIKLYLHHYSQPDPKDQSKMKMQAHTKLKPLMKELKFRWKVLKNDADGTRMEMYEAKAAVSSDDNKNN